MKTYGFLYEEKLTYHKEIRIETDLSEDELLAVIDEAEHRADSIEDIVINLEKYERVNVTNEIDSDYSSPTDVDVEYFDHREIKEGNK